MPVFPARPLLLQKNPYCDPDIVATFRKHE
jgi:hypothetical protein